MPDAIPSRLAQLLDDLSFVDDRSERIEILIDTADRFVEVPPEIATRPFDERHRAPNCESEAFVFSTPREDGTLDFHFAVDNPQGISARAMAVILRETCSAEPLDSVIAIPADVPYQLFGRELSMGKNMGLMGMVALVQVEARRARGATHS